MANKKHYALILIPIIFFIGISVFFFYSSPESIIAYIGLKNSYALIFVLSMIGGMTTFSGVPYHIVMIALAAGGLNPFFLGFTTAMGVMLGDSTSYYIAYQGRTLMSDRVHTMLDRLSFLKDKYPRLLPLFFFVFGSLAPLSNDIITIPTGFLRYPFWRVIIPLGVGNIIFNVILSLLAIHSYQFIQTIF